MILTNRVLNFTCDNLNNYYLRDFMESLSDYHCTCYICCIFVCLWFYLCTLCRTIYSSSFVFHCDEWNKYFWTTKKSTELPKHTENRCLIIVLYYNSTLYVKNFRLWLLLAQDCDIWEREKNKIPSKYVEKYFEKIWNLNTWENLW